jgi:undecaprenyl-diphosphatase
LPGALNDFTGAWPLMNRFDSSIVHFLNIFAHRSWMFDSFIAWVADVNLTKGGIALGLFWWAWFKKDEGVVPEKREFLIFAFVSSSIAMFVAQVLTFTLPYRERPLREPLIHFRVPYGVYDELWHTLTSFPSDHAALFFCLAATLWMVSRRLGIVAVCHALFVVCLPRIYLGFHYPTDILAGALLGIGAAYLCKFTRLRKGISRPFFRWLEKHPASFYAFSFVMTFEVAELFWSARMFLSFAFHGLGSFLRLRGPA